MRIQDFHRSPLLNPILRTIFYQKCLSGKLAANALPVPAEASGMAKETKEVENGATGFECSKKLHNDPFERLKDGCFVTVHTDVLRDAKRQVTNGAEFSNG